MICPHCGKETADDAQVCQHCGEALTPIGKPPRLLGQIQGLAPSEPVIVQGRLQNPDALIPLERLPDPDQFMAASAAETPSPTADTPAPTPTPDLSQEAPAADSPSGDEPPIAEPSIGPGPILPPRGHSRRRMLIAALFFLVILAGALCHRPTWGQLAPNTSVKNAFTFVEILPPGSRVLLVWDYDPATQGEMQLLAQAVLQHLQRQQVRMVNVSLRPFGPDMATEALALSNRWRPQGQAVNTAPPVEFGFLPGESAALRALANSPVIASNQPRRSAHATGLQASDTLASFDLIIEFSAHFANSQQWVEQVASRTGTPLIIAASGAVAPVLRPYEQTGQIRVLLAGYPDALAYESLLTQEGPAHQQAASQTLTLGLMLLLGFAAAVRSLFRQ